jgi:hypothetical protein
LPALAAWLHDTHLPSHALSQHTPSTQKPEAQSLALEQVTPFLLLQLPLPSHACPFEQLPGTSVPAAACMQVPSWPTTAQDRHGSEQDALEQHNPSTQKPEAQFDALVAVQPSPLPRFATLYSQVSLTPAFAQSYCPAFGSPKGLGKPPPKSTITPRWLSKAMVGEVAMVGPLGRVRRYQVEFLVSSSQVLMLVVTPAPFVQYAAVTCRRRKLS